jgi:Fic family protein
MVAMLTCMEADQYRASDLGEARRTIGPHGYVAFFPKSIPRSVELSSSTISLLTEAEAALGRLVGVGHLLPNPHLLIRPYVLREALASTRIEGTRASLTEMLEFDASGGKPNADVEEVINYVDALQWGIARLDDLPICSRLLREVHERVLAGVRGRERQPGQFRSTQNWIGGPTSTIESAPFVPPPPDELARLIADWEQFANDENGEMPLLVQNALLHYQFETIHPFLDGNGRLGRLLIVLFLVARGRLREPLLYVSSFFEARRDVYFESLQMAQRTGDVMPWVELFLEAVRSEATDAFVRARSIVALREKYRSLAANLSANAVALVEIVCESPVVTARIVEERVGVTRPTAIVLLRQLESVGVLKEEKSGSRSQLRFVAQELIDVIAGDARR